MGTPPQAHLGIVGVHKYEASTQFKEGTYVQTIALDGVLEYFNQPAHLQVRSETH